MWKHTLCDIIIKFSCRRLFKFIYVQIKLNASRNRFMIGCESGSGRITLVKLRSFVARMCESSFFAFSFLSSCANRIACWINFETASQSQTISMQDKHTHTCASAYALNGAHRLHKYINLITERVSSVAFSRFGVSADCWVLYVCVCALEHHRENDTHKYVTGISIILSFFRFATSRVCVGRPLK